MEPLAGVGGGEKIGERFLGGEDRVGLIEKVFPAPEAMGSFDLVGRSAMAAVARHQKAAFPAKGAMVPIPYVALWTVHTETLPQRYMTSNEECPYFFGK